MQIIVLDGLEDAVRHQFDAQLLETPSERPELAPLANRDRQFAAKQFLVAGGKRGDPQIRNAVSEMLGSMNPLPALKFGVARQDRKPEPGWIAEVSNPCARVGDQ